MDSAATNTLPYQRRHQKNLEDGIAECLATGRWLQFPEKATLIDGKGFMWVSVMQRAQDGQPQKVHELVLAKEDIIAILNKIETDDGESQKS
jgi:hypothetical protein